MAHPNPNAFTGNPLDRAGVRRKDEGWIDEMRRHPDALLLPFHAGAPLVHRTGEKSTLQWLTMDALSILPGRREPILLGLANGAPRWAVDATLPQMEFSDLGTYAPLRSVASQLPPGELAIAGQATWMVGWHHRHQFCPRTGVPTTSAEGGAKRITIEEGREYFPKVDPVVIALPCHEGSVCLGRGVGFPVGMMSALAGFVEPGESLEECVAREIFEEVGLTVTRTEYVFSQPWPFPASLMTGFIADVTGKELTLDPDEIAEARWFSKQEISDHLTGASMLEGLFLPPAEAIAHQLLMDWVNR